MASALWQVWSTPQQQGTLKDYSNSARTYVARPGIAKRPVCRTLDAGALGYLVAAAALSLLRVFLPVCDGYEAYKRRLSGTVATQGRISSMQVYALTCPEPAT